MGLAFTVSAITAQAPQNRRDVIIPQWRASQNAPGWVDYMIAPGDTSQLPTRGQYAYNVQDLGLPRATLTGISFRKAQVGNNMPAVTVTTTITLSHAPFPPQQLSPYFAPNHGLDKAVVFNGSFNLPASPPSVRPAFVPPITFQRPFIFDVTRGLSLVIEFRTTATSTPGQPWVVHCAAKDTGRFTVDWALGCWLKYQNFYNSVLYPKLYPGGMWDYAWYTIPKNASCVATLGFTGAGGYWGPYKLPVAIGECGWAVASELFVPFQTDMTGYGVIPKVPIPPDDRLIDTSFYDQCMCFTPGLNAVGLVTFFSAKFTIGSGGTPDAKTLIGINDNASGSVQPIAPIFRLYVQ